MGRGLAAMARRPPQPPPCADEHRGGGPILPTCASMHMGGEPWAEGTRWWPCPPLSAAVHGASPRPPPPPPPACPPPPQQDARVSLPPPPSSPNLRHGHRPAPPARRRGWVCTVCMAGRYVESSGQPSSAPQAACEPQDQPSNQIKSNQIKSGGTPPPPHHTRWGEVGAAAAVAVAVAVAHGAARCLTSRPQHLQPGSKIMKATDVRSLCLRMRTELPPSPLTANIPGLRRM